MAETPYSSISAAPDQYNAATVLSRIVDGLGFRYHWATEGLGGEVLGYRPEESCRSIGETLDHIHNIVDMVEHSLVGETYLLPEPEMPGDVDVRRATLEAIQRVSQRLRDSDPADMAEWKARFRMGEDDMEFPFWNTINGTMTDAIYHVGQVVAHRRAAGAPMDENVNVFLGTQAAHVGTDWKYPSMGPTSAPSNKELLLWACKPLGSSPAFAGVLEGAAAEFRDVSQLWEGYEDSFKCLQIGKCRG